MQVAMILSLILFPFAGLGLMLWKGPKFGSPKSGGSPRT